MAREANINMLPSKGAPDLNAAAKLMVPLVLDALYQSDAQQSPEEKSVNQKDEKITPICPVDAKEE